MSATAAFTKPEQTVTFTAYRSELRLVKTAKHPIFGQNGQRQGESVGETVAWRDGILKVPTSGKMTLEDGRKVDAADILSWLREHRLYGDADDGFKEIGQVAPPVSEAEMQTIIDASIALDVETLEAIRREEDAGWKREQVITAVDKALDGVSEARAAVEKEIAERVQNAEKAAVAKMKREENEAKAAAAAAEREAAKDKK